MLVHREARQSHKQGDAVQIKSTLERSALGAAETCRAMLGGTARLSLALTYSLSSLLVTDLYSRASRSNGEDGITFKEQLHRPLVGHQLAPSDGQHSNLPFCLFSLGKKG